MQNNFFGSKLNTILLSVLIVLMAIAIHVMRTYKAIYVPVVSQGDATEEMKQYTNDRLGFSFSYPEPWRDVSENINSVGGNSFGYNLNLEAGSVEVWGLSYPYSDAGRDGYEADLREKDLAYQGCGTHTTEVIKSKDGTEGVYTLARLTPGLGGCEDFTTNHYAVFDINKKVTNIVFIGDPNKISKSDFLKVVNSVVIN